MATFADVRAIAMALPEAEEILTWETDVTFRVRAKIFVIGGDGSDSISIKATPAVQAELIERDPATFRPSAYVGRFGWVTANLERIDDELLRSLILEAWRMTAPKRLAASLRADRSRGLTGPVSRPTARSGGGSRSPRVRARPRRDAPRGR